MALTRRWTPISTGRCPATKFIMKSALQVLTERFNLLWFVMSLGLGGTSVAGFAVLNYVFPTPTGHRGMVHQASVDSMAESLVPLAVFAARYLEGHIAAFAVFHLLTVTASFLLYRRWKTKYPERYRALIDDNTQNALTVAPALTLSMTFNVFLVGGFYFSAHVREHMQTLMPYAFLAWGGIFLYTMTLVLRVQRAHLQRGFDVLSMHFGWLIIPFALAMLAVSGSGIAALSRDLDVAGLAAFLSFMPFSAATFLLGVKLTHVFRTQYRQGLPEQSDLLPSFLTVIPIITLLSISLFRYGHFFDQHYGHLPKAWFALVTGLGWAFELWYLSLGLLLLAPYFRHHLFSLRTFHESQWGLVCPLVALSVLGAFVYHAFLPIPAVALASQLLLLADVVLIAWMTARQVLLLRSAPRAGSAQVSTLLASPVD